MLLIKSFKAANHTIVLKENNSNSVLRVLSNCYKMQLNKLNISVIPYS